MNRAKNNMEKYQCAKCLRNFPLQNAVDGYSQGFKRGFLCPLCGANLIEAGQSDDLGNLQYGYRYALLVFIIVRFSQHLPWQLTTFDHPLANECLLILVLLLVPSWAFIKINAGKLFSARLVYTRRVVS